MATTSNMFMYSITMQQPALVTHAVIGHFYGRSRDQQIVLAQGSYLNMHQLDDESGQLELKMSYNVFGIIRQLALTKVAGAKEDYLIVTSDSGRISILEYIEDENTWNRVQLETYGKSGARRVIPGQYLAADPMGRACMVASVEKNKLVYVLNRNTQTALTISSPLEAHKPQTLVYALISLDTQWDNPIFASLELDYTEVDQDITGQAASRTVKNLVYYQLDLGLNHVVRLGTMRVDRTSNMLVRVPGGISGPSGVLVCSEDGITYRHFTSERRSVPALFVPIPRRMGAAENPNRKRFITASAVHTSTTQAFFLLQSEDGDIFKAWIDLKKKPGTDQYTADADRLMIKYFGTVPLANHLLLSRSGWLYVASESSDQYMYQIIRLAEEDGQPEWSSEDFPMRTPWEPEPYEPIYFDYRSLEAEPNLEVLQTFQKMNPIMESKVLNLTGTDAPQIYSICGNGARSTFKTVTHGLEVNQVAHEELPVPPLTAVWTTKLNADDAYDSWIVLSSPGNTLVLAFGDSIEQVENSGLIENTNTLVIQQMGQDAVIQVHPQGIRQVRSNGKTVDWNAPQHRTIVAGTANERQVAVALSSGEIIYFELSDNGDLNEYDDVHQVSANVNCLSMGEVPHGRVRSNFLAVGCDDSTLRILSLDPDSVFESKAIQALSAAPLDLCIMAMPDSSSGSYALFLHVGLYSGVYIRALVDDVLGSLSDARSQFLGAKAVRLLRTVVAGEPAILALTTRPWLIYPDKQTKIFSLTPLDYLPLNWASNVSAEDVVSQGILGIEGSSIRIFTILPPSTRMIQKDIRLQYTPRKFVNHPEFPLFYVVESDANTLSKATRKQLADAQTNGVNGHANGINGTDFNGGAKGKKDEDEGSSIERMMPDIEPLSAQIGPPGKEPSALEVKYGIPRGQGHWASCIQVVDPVQQVVTTTFHLADNECAISVACVPFSSQDDEAFLVIGTAKNYVPSPRSYECGYIHIYRIHEGKNLEFIHKTRTEYPPAALLSFRGRLLAGVGPDLRIYDLGMKQILRKSHLKDLTANFIVSLDAMGNRIVVGDVRESVTYLVYRQDKNTLVPFADDVVPRWVTSSAMIDYGTCAGGDKFGNLWAVRVPEEVSNQADGDASRANLIFAKGYLHGTPNRVDPVVHVHVNDIPTSVVRTPLVNGGKDVLLWTGLSGTIGALVPLEVREDVDYFVKLERFVREEETNMVGRDQLVYRGYYVPVKGVIDGDLCERYFALDVEAQMNIAAKMGRPSARDVEKRIGDVRGKVAW